MIFHANWHTHTPRCGHAVGSMCEYCAEAVKGGIKVLGFSDHTPFADGIPWPGGRMKVTQLREYVAELEEAKREFPELELHIGLECEWVNDYYGFYDELFDVHGMEYLVAGFHFMRLDPSSPVLSNTFSRNHVADRMEYLRAYAHTILTAIGSGYFSFIAHPDLFGHFSVEWTPDHEALSRDIAQASLDTDTPLEININGMRKPLVQDADGAVRMAYPWHRFWRIAAEEGCKVIVNSDAHHPWDMCDMFGRAYEFAKEAGVADANIVQSIRLGRRGESK